MVLYSVHYVRHYRADTSVPIHVSVVATHSFQHGLILHKLHNTINKYREQHGHLLDGLVTS